MGLSRYVIADIETLPDPDAVPLLRPLERKTTPPKSMSKPETIAAWHAEQEQEHALALAEQRASLSLDPLGCRIINMAWMTEQDHSEREWGDDGEWGNSTEWQALQVIWDAVRNGRYSDRRSIVGYNIRGFDMGVLHTRSVLLGVDVPPLSEKPWDTDIIDLADHPFIAGYRKGWSEKRPIPRDLKTVCRRLGIPVTDDISGADIARLYAEGRYDLIAQHVTSDVQLTRALAERLGVIKAGVTA